MAQTLRKNNVTDHDGSSRLHDVIRRFIEVTHTLAGDWTIDANGIDELMLTLLREIDETMLPRAFSISTDTGMSARMLISNRRLICLDIDSNARSTDQSLPTDPEAAANLYARQLQDVFHRSREIRFRSTGRENEAMATSISCSAQGLAESFGIPLNSQSKPNKLDEFIRKVEPFALASVRVSSGQQDQDVHGSDQMVSLLTALVQRRAKTAPHHTQPPQIASAQPRCEIVQLNDALSLVQAFEQDEKILFLVGAEEIGNVSTNWQRVYGLPNRKD